MLTFITYYNYCAVSTNNEGKEIARFTVNLNPPEDALYNLGFTLQTSSTRLTEEDKQILAQDILDFMEKCEYQTYSEIDVAGQNEIND